MADIKLESFKGIVKDLARPNRFFVAITGNQGGASWDDDLTFFVKECQLPGRTIGEIELKWQGMSTKISGDPSFEDLTMTMLNDYEWKVRQYLQDWMEGNVTIGTEGDNIRAVPETYKAEISIKQLGRTGETLGEWQCVGCVLKQMDAIALSQDESDAVETLSLTFSVDYWVKIQ